MKEEMFIVHFLVFLGRDGLQTLLGLSTDRKANDQGSQPPTTSIETGTGVEGMLWMHLVRSSPLE
jgi:hypothetical protein